MLATGRKSLSEIALHSQFSSQSSFTRAFRRRHWHDAGRVPANAAIAVLGRAHPSHNLDPADRAGSGVPDGPILRVRLIGVVRGPGASPRKKGQNNSRRGGERRSLRP